jgi:hypothetical protein
MEKASEQDQRSPAQDVVAVFSAGAESTVLSLAILE